MPQQAIRPPTLASLAGVTRTFAEGSVRRTVLHGADLTIARGELLVLLGRSGSGKSTLLNLLAGIDLPTAGSVWVDGVELSAVSERERTLFRRRRLGFVFQAYNLLPTLTVEENLLLPLELAGRADRSGRERALDLLERVGLVDRRGSFPDRLSGGEQQRVAVARALVHEPVLVLADEPTGNLDLDSGLAVLALLDELTRQTGKTLVMVTHGREVVGLADRVLTLSEGRLAEAEGRSNRAKAAAPSP